MMNLSKQMITKRHVFVQTFLVLALLFTLISTTGCGIIGARHVRSDLEGEHSKRYSDLGDKERSAYSITLASGEIVTQAEYIAKRQPVFLFFYSPT